MRLVEIGNKPKVNGENVEEELNHAIEYAKENNILNMAIVMIGEDGSVLDCWANNNKPFVMVGALESLKMEFMKGCIEGRE